jgi:hypothetical protein
MTALLARPGASPPQGPACAVNASKRPSRPNLRPPPSSGNAIPLFMIVGEMVLWQQTFLVSPREKGRATCHWEPHARINEVVYYLLRRGTIKLPLLVTSNDQPHRAANRKPISVADACGSSFINNCDPAVYCHPSENSRFSDIPIGAASELMFILSERDYLRYLAKLHGAEPALRGDDPERRVFSGRLSQLSKYFRRRHAMITFDDHSEFSQATGLGEVIESCTVEDERSHGSTSSSRRSRPRVASSIAGSSDSVTVPCNNSTVRTRVSRLAR